MNLLTKVAWLMLCVILFEKSSAQQIDWNMQPVPLYTRWAKDVSPMKTQENYPRPNLKRKNWVNLNGLWDYVITDDNQSPTIYTGKILVPYPIESALSGVKKQLLPNQYLWYKKTISKPLIKSGEKVILNFGAVDWQANIYINGKQAGSHSGGYTAFSTDITDFLIPGNNEISVKVFDPSDKGIGPHGKQVLNPGNIYYTSSSGIWQTVWLEIVPKIYITKIITTPNIDKSTLTINVYSSDKKSKVEFEAIAFKQGREIAKWHSFHNKGQLTITKPSLWSPEDPFLYDLKVRIKLNGKTIDEIGSYFGMRKISILKDVKGIDRIALNNKPYFNLGTLDQGFWPEGLYTAPTDEALAFDIKAIKAMGFNTIRKHIKVEPANWYYNADKLGILVWQDMVNPNQLLPAGSKQQFEKECQEILSQFHNYPSITTWVLFNEKWGQYDQDRLTKWIKQEDPSRIVNGHSGEFLYVNDQLRSPSPNAYVNADMTDVHSYPNPKMSLKQVGKAQVCGEFGGIGVSVLGHQWDDVKGWGYIQVKGDELVGKYKGMIAILKQLKEEGLSGSIYTQPFDVEGEENGLMTYDREIIKIPLDKIRAIHKEIIDFKQNNASSKFNIATMDQYDNDDRYSELQGQYTKGKKDSAFLRRLVLMSLRKQDKENAPNYGNAYIENLKSIYEKDNLSFIKQITRTSRDTGFSIFLKNREKVDRILGPNVAENKIKGIISIEEIKPFTENPNSDPDWQKIHKSVEDKGGAIGLEKLYGIQMIWYGDKKDWQNFGKYYGLYYKTAFSRSEYHINNVSWTLFEHVSDIDILNIAVFAAKYNVDKFANNDPIDIDTYANLLYKSGKKDDAIIWEKKAVDISNNGKEYIEVLEKMRKGLPTWPNQ